MLFNRLFSVIFGACSGIICLALFQTKLGFPAGAAWILSLILALLFGFTWHAYPHPALFLRLRRHGYRQKQAVQWLIACLLGGIFLAAVLPVNFPASAANEPVPLFYDLLYKISCGGLIGFGLFALSAWLAAWLAARRVQPFEAAPTSSRFAFITFSIPMLVVWSLYLLAFFPGIMNKDSLDQWAQMTTGIYDDWHPAFHTMFNWLVTRLWLSPAAVAISQIVLLSLVIGCGLQLMRNAGAPLAAVWLVDWIFALSPVNSTMSIALWKDIPFSIALLALSLILLKIAITHGDWLEKKNTALLLGFVSAFVCLFRHNGWPVVVVALAGLFLIFKQQRRAIALVSGLCLGLFILVRGPIYELVGVDRSRAAVNRNLLLVHQIGAYLHAGVPLTPQEKLLLKQVQPLGKKWHYDCFNLEPSVYNPEFNWAFFSENGSTLAPVLLDLIIRAPRVEINHLLCVSSLVWRITPPPGSFLYTYTHQKKHGLKPEYLEKNDLGLAEKPLLPQLQTYLYEFLGVSNRAAVWRPALYLYLGIFFTIIGALRLRNRKVLIFILPATISAVLFMLVNMAQYFRYMYPAYLVGLFSILLIFLPENEPVDADLQRAESRKPAS